MDFIETKVDKLVVEVHQNRSNLGSSASRQVAAKMKEVIEQKNEVRVVFASAPSQNEFLAGLCQEKGIKWDKVVAFHQDEYVGAAPEDDYCFGKFINVNLFDKVKPGTIHYIDGLNDDVEDECNRYAALLNEKPIDIICLGIGENGHVAFIEPHEADFNDTKELKRITLDEKCRNQQFHDFGFKSIEDVPKWGITMTIPAIMKVDYIYCMVPSVRKAEAVKDTLTGPVVEKCPASILRRHDKAILFLDRDSASLVGGLE